MMTDYSPLLEDGKYSLQQRVLHELAKLCWGNLVLREYVHRPYMDFYKELGMICDHQSNVLKNLPQVLNSFSKSHSHFPEPLLGKVIDAVTSLKQGYIEALNWEQRYLSSLPFTIFNPVRAREYQAIVFIDPNGHFNDLAWAKSFVADHKQSLHRRFQFACLYCLEETITNIWDISQHKLPYKGRLEDIEKWSKFRLVRSWAYKLEHRFHELIAVNSSYIDGFYISGFIDSVYSGHIYNEYAAQFFWTHCSTKDRSLLLKKPNFLNYLYVPASQNKARFMHWIYWDLTLEEKLNIFSISDVETNFNFDLQRAEIWICLLVSPFYERVLDDILNFPISISTEIYGNVLSDLIWKMGKSEIPTCTKSEIPAIFKKLWCSLSVEQKIEVLEMEGDILGGLAKMRAINLLEIIVKPLPNSTKEKMLLDDWRNKSAIVEISKIGDYNTIFRYLLCFLIDCESITQEQSLRDDASKLLDRFTKKIFHYFTQKSVPESAKKEFYKVIEDLQQLQVSYPDKGIYR